MDLILSLPGLFSAIILHELGHGYVAYKLGDDTAKNAGRLTLNPLKHLDPVGFICMLVLKFGWAKPVPINPMNFKHRKRDMILVSLAGPMVNFILFLLIGIFMSLNLITSPIVFQIFEAALWYNVMLCVFNLLPFPPLDGSKIVAGLLPVKMEYYFYKYERYLSLILLVLIANNSIDKLLTPLIMSFVQWLNRLLSFILI